MFPDERAATDAVLRAYPDVLCDKHKREEYILGLITSTPAAGDKPLISRRTRSSSLSQQDRYVMAIASDKHIQRANKIIRAIQQGTATLNSTHIKVMRSIFFYNMKPIEAAEASGFASPSYVRQIANEVREIMYPYCIRVYELVCKYREDQQEEKLDILRKAELLNTIGDKLPEEK